MPRVAPPTDGDLPVFPAAQQYSGRTEVNTRPVERRTASGQSANGQARQQQSIEAARRQEAQYRQQQQQQPVSRQPVPTQQPPRVQPGTNRIPSHHSQHQQEPMQARASPTYRPTRIETHSPPVNDMRRMNINDASSQYAQPSPIDHGPRRPVMGVQAGTGRNSPHNPYNTNFVGQPFGVVPEDTSRAPPYDPVLWKIFCQVDSDGSGAITQSELSHALINGDFTPFHVDTIALMIRLFDEDRNGTISFTEFEKLWKYLLEWKLLFSRFDVDHSGTISFPEFNEALAAFGYRLTTNFVQFLFRYHDKNRTKEMSFDLFVQSCVTLKLFTDVFKKFDTDMDGVITIGFEEFLKVMIRNR